MSASPGTIATGSVATGSAGAALTLSPHDQPSPHDQWYFAESALSLAGTRLWADLDRASRQRVSFHEAVNFFSQLVHAEAAFAAGVASRTSSLWGSEAAGAETTGYLQMLRDDAAEAGGGCRAFCDTYAGGLYPPPLVDLAEDPPSAAEFLFYARAMIRQDITDRLNTTMVRDPALAPAVRDVLAERHGAQTRHLAFTRWAVVRLFATCQDRWTMSLLEQVRSALLGHVDAVWLSLHHPRIYEDAGLGNGWDLARISFTSPAARARRAALSARSLRFLQREGILDALPDWADGR